jgi:hypothetical protein
MMESISIVVYPLSEVVYDGIAGRLMWQAPGLDIYLSGKYTAARWAAIQHLAVEQCVARHIPVISLRRVGGYRTPPRKKVPAGQKGLFDGDK